MGFSGSMEPIRTNRRGFIAGLSTGVGGAGIGSSALAAPQPYFRPAWESLTGRFAVPEWFRDAKFGIWAHWGPQCVPMAGDWYARRMYLQGDWKYDHHLANYGHPTKTGYVDLLDGWTAERWEPEKLLDLYQRAGAKYFMALAVHHDNFDTFASLYHPWNATRIGPKRDIVGTWERLARKRGMKFAISNHGSHAWHWFQPAYGYDPEGPLRGVRYDAWRLSKADGKGKSWEGLDPQALYTGRHMVMPDGIDSIAKANAWHEANDRVWTEAAPADGGYFAEHWKARAIDAIDRYRPDLVYFDNTGDLPMGQAGLDVTAHLYNRGIEWHGAPNMVGATAKVMPPDKARAVIDDVERGNLARIADEPWQSDTCLGDWFYDEGVFLRHEYKTAKSVIHRLCDTVSKNGNLMLSVPIRPDGAIDADEHAILTEIGDWMAVGSEAIFGTRPAHVFGEGPTDVAAGMMDEHNAKPFTARDVRYTRKGRDLYAIALGIPDDRTIRLRALAGCDVQSVRLLGTSAQLGFRQEDGEIVIQLPDRLPSRHAIALHLPGAARPA